MKFVDEEACLTSALCRRTAAEAMSDPPTRAHAQLTAVGRGTCCGLVISYCVSGEGRIPRTETTLTYSTVLYGFLFIYENKYLNRVCALYVYPVHTYTRTHRVVCVAAGAVAEARTHTRCSPPRAKAEYTGALSPWGSAPFCWASSGTLECTTQTRRGLQAPGY